MKLIVNPELSIHPFHGNSAVPVVICEVPDNSGRPRRYLVPQRLWDLVCTCDGKLERGQAVAAMAERSNGDYTAQEIEQLTNEFLIPRQVLLDSEVSSQPVIAARRLDRYLFLKVRFLRKEVVFPVASALGFLFQPAAWKCLLALMLVSHFWFYLALTHLQTPQIDSLPNSALPWLLLVLAVSVLLHEFGHAAALTRFGGRNAEIGAGLYICFLALFVDLSEAWRLTNRQRVVVDLAGMYFQGILLVFLAIVFAITGGPIWGCCFLLTDIQIAANLNPLLRLDGYWALADALGIPNLRRRSLRWILFPMIGRRTQEPQAQTTPGTLRAMRIYLILSLLFSAYLVRTLSLQCYSVVRNYPAVIREGVFHWQTGSIFEALLSLLAALWRGMILIGLAVLLIRAVSWALQQARLGSFPRRKSWKIS